MIHFLNSDVILHKGKQDYNYNDINYNFQLSTLYQLSTLSSVFATFFTNKTSSISSQF